MNDTRPVINDERFRHNETKSASGGKSQSWRRSVGSFVVKTPHSRCPPLRYVFGKGIFDHSSRRIHATVITFPKLMETLS